VKGWKWGAYGKHPVVKDYIRLGEQSPLMDAFSRWVEAGYAALSQTGTPHSWRFFAKGPQGSEIACGLVRDSRDGVGRAFPLLILGTGALEMWEARWPGIPEACEASWQRMEYLCARRMFDLAELKGALARLPSPAWPEHGGPVEPAPNLPPLEGGAVHAPLPETGDQRAHVARLLTGFKAAGANPEAVFIGGRMKKPGIAIFTRGLFAEDFGRLWQAE